MSDKILQSIFEFLKNYKDPQTNISYDQQNPNIPVEPLKGIYPDGQGVTTNSKAKTEIPVPGTQKPIDTPAIPDSETTNDNGEADTLKLEDMKLVPDSLKNDNTLNNVKSGNNLPESIDSIVDPNTLIQ